MFRRISVPRRNTLQSTVHQHCTARYSAVPVPVGGVLSVEVEAVKLLPTPGLSLPVPNIVLLLQGVEFVETLQLTHVLPERDAQPQLQVDNPGGCLQLTESSLPTRHAILRRTSGFTFNLEDLNKKKILKSLIFIFTLCG